MDSNQQVIDAMNTGDLRTAVQLLRSEPFRDNTSYRQLAHQLTNALVVHADGCTSAGNLHQAWDDLSNATSIAIPSDADLLSRKKNQLVELTIETAETWLAHGKSKHAIRSIEELSSRKILDWRADRVSATAQLLRDADEDAATGKMKDSVARLEKARDLHPELDFIQSRLSANRQRAMQIRELTATLQEKTIAGEWSEVKSCCQKLLAIAPKYQMAIDAQRHCLTQMKRKTHIGIQPTHVPEKDDSGIRFGNQNSDEGSSNPPPIDESLANTFLMWVDGVGGFLVCVSDRNIIGQAISPPDISIPIMGDLRRRHARMETIDGQHLLQFLDTNRKIGFAVDEPLALRDGQTLKLDGGVLMKYSQTHPLSSTARLDFISRHRTQPWSDAILLAGQSIILGPNKNNHVYCPSWEHDLILFRRQEQWFCRSSSRFSIDGKPYDNEGPITFNSTVVGDDFSMTMEPLIAKN